MHVPPFLRISPLSSSRIRIDFEPSPHANASRDELYHSRTKTGNVIGFTTKARRARRFFGGRACYCDHPVVAMMSVKTGGRTGTGRAQTRHQTCAARRGTGILPVWRRETPPGQADACPSRYCASPDNKTGRTRRIRWNRKNRRNRITRIFRFPRPLLTITSYFSSSIPLNTWSQRRMGDWVMRTAFFGQISWQQLQLIQRCVSRAGADASAGRVRA